ncbi:MAG: DsrE family protein [Candidatus Bathyarchaeota archaeon]|jgi:sulfur relay (sulfurtransferase) complex TusBCD TusD component (DsrE family)
MGKLLIALFSSPVQFQNANTAFNFAKAAVKQGHRVTIFCDLDAVYTLKASQISHDEETPTAKLAKLVEEGVHVLACMESARLRGIAKEELIHGVEQSSLARLVELMEESDRVVAFKS